jgi:uncharacterized protein (TIGR02246 family)
MRATIFILVAALADPLAAADTASVQAAAETVLRQRIVEQTAAWNRGDLESFVSDYAEDALFITPSGTVRGRAEVLRRYRQRYPDRRAMGRLALEVQEVRSSACSGGETATARLLARWTLEPEGGPAAAARSGPTFLVYEQRAGRWSIVEDVSMEAEPPDPGG